VVETRYVSGLACSDHVIQGTENGTASRRPVRQFRDIGGIEAECALQQPCHAVGIGNATVEVRFAGGINTCVVVDTDDDGSFSHGEVSCYSSCAARQALVAGGKRRELFFSNAALDLCL
jgi:hypothetical protein